MGKIRESEAEVRNILKERLDEETHSELEISAYDTERNERAKKHRRELVRGKVHKILVLSSNAVKKMEETV